MGSLIKRIEYYLPDNILTNSNLNEEFPEWDALKIAEKVGIKQRHIVSENQTATDLAIKAAEKVLSNYDANRIDFILYCTQSPEFILPTSACIIQDKLGIRTSVGAIDFNLGCSGFIYGLSLAKGLINSEIASNVLLITSETYSRYLHKLDKGNRSIFGDGAAASIISVNENEKIGKFELGTDGKGYDKLIVRNGASRNKFQNNPVEIINESGFVCNDNYLFMDGPEIFNFTIQNIPPLVNKALSKNDLSIDTIDFVIFHQANKYMLDYLRKKLKIPVEKFYQNMENTGNTVSATIPIALKDSLDRNLIKSGDKVLIVGFGVGYSWGATVIEI